MKVLNLSILCLISSVIAFGQNSTRLSGKPQKMSFTKYSLKKRMSFYPFDTAFKISIVSFDKIVKKIDSADWRFGKSAYNKYEGDVKYGLPFLNDTICISKLAQTKILSAKQLDTLTDILYNTCYRWTITESDKAFCYMPHNAILFFDNDDKVFDYIEICFDCYQIKFSNNDIERFEECNFTFTGLKNYFRHMGLFVTEKDFKQSRH